MPPFRDLSNRISKMFVRVKPMGPDSTNDDSKEEETITPSHFRHLETCLRLFGIYFDPLGRRSVFRQPSPVWRKVFNFITSVNAALVHVVSMILAIRTVFLFRWNDGFSLWNMLCVGILCNIVSTQSIGTAMSYLFPRHLPGLFHQMQHVCKKDLRRSMKYFTILAVLICIGVFIIILINYRNVLLRADDILPSTSEIIRFYPFNPYSDHGIMAVYVYITQVICSSFVLVTLVLLIISIILGREFTHITSNIRACLGNHRDLLEKQLEQIRLHYEKINELVTKADAFLQYSSLLGFFFGISYFCYCLYFLARDVPTGDVSTIYILMLTSIFQVVFYAFAGSFLSSRAHSAKDILLQYSVNDLGETAYKTISLFLYRVTGPPIGITMFGIFTIDRASSLTVFGTILSYAVLVLQMSPSSSTTNCNCFNGTSV